MKLLKILEPSSGCTQDCNQGRNCTCNKRNETLEPPSCTGSQKVLSSASEGILRKLFKWLK